MREIKFRITVTSYASKEFLGFMYSEVRNGGFSISPQIMSNDCVIGDEEQFIGLHDINGKEIYEGDILRIINPPEYIQKAEIIGIVIFLTSSFGVEIKKINRWEKYRVEPPEIRTVLWFLNLMNSKPYEVIGNVHENPELLKEST